MNKAITLSAVLALAASSNLGAAEATAPAAPAAPAASGSTAAAPAPAVDKYPDVGKDFVKEWTVEELYRSANLALNKGGRNFERGQKVFEVTGCSLCHHFGGGVGGIGPDLTGVGGKFGAKEILESIIEPSAVISDLYGKVIVTTTEGRRYEGRPAGQTADTYSIIPAPSIDPATGTMAWIGPIRNIPLNTVADIEDSPTSPMPTGLINNIKEEEIYDFLAFLISAGNPDDKMFKVKPATPAAPAAK